MGQSQSQSQPGPSHAPGAQQGDQEPAANPMLRNMVLTSKSTTGVVAANSNVNITGNLTVNPPPEETFPELAVPRVSRLFQGREDDIVRLRDLFLVEGKRKVVIAGLAGYGKTELAKHIASRARDGGHVHRVFWVRAENDDQLKKTHDSLSNIYQTHKNNTILCVFDNAVSRRDISAYLPPDTASALVLVTSQVHDWGDDIETLPIKPVSEPASFEIFKEILGPRYERVTQNKIKEIIKFMDGIPLGLVVVAGYLRRAMDALGSDFDIIKFKKDILSSSALDKGIDRAVDSPYRHTIRAAIHCTLNNMSPWLSPQENNITHQVLCVCAHLNPNRIKIKHVEEILHMCGTRDNGLLRLCVDTVKDFSFIQPENDEYFAIHRLCQEFLRSYYDDEKKNMKEACYRGCVQWELKNKNRSRHRAAILTQADNNKTAVNEILRKYCLSGDNLALQPSHPNYLNMQTFLQLLVHYACYECIFSFLNGVNISSRQRVVNEMELVHSAAFATDGRAVNVVRLLVEMGGDIRARTRRGETALHRAILVSELGNEAVVRALLDIGSDVLATDRNGRTVLHLAARWGHEAVVRLLLDAGSDVHARNITEETALHLAARKGQEAVVRMLLDAGSDVHATDRDGRTAQHEAARWGNEAVVRVLLDAGSDVHAKDRDGRTALHLAACGRVEAVVRVLLDVGSDVRATDKYGRTALHCTVWRGEEAVVRVLLDAGADVNAKDCEGRTALDAASTRGRTRVPHILREASLNINNREH